MEATNLNSVAPVIAQLEQTKAIQEANYEHLATGIEKSHIDQALDTGKAPNIKWVQQPSPPMRDWKKTYKMLAMVAFGGIFAGLAWAFLTEFFLDRSFRRPAEIEAKLKVPLFLSIPDVRRNGHSRRAGITDRRPLELNPRNRCRCRRCIRRGRSSVGRQKAVSRRWSRWNAIRRCTRFAKRCVTG